MFFSRRKNDDLSEKLVKLVVPIAIQQFMLALVSATDAVMLGFVRVRWLVARTANTNYIRTT